MASLIVVIGVSFPRPAVKPCALARQLCTVNSVTVLDFCKVYNTGSFFNVNHEFSPSQLSAEELLSSFNSACTGILDTIAPLKVRRTKSKSEPWLNDSTRALQQVCRREERKWKNNKLQVSYDIFRGSLSKYQIIVKRVRANFFLILLKGKKINK